MPHFGEKRFKKAERAKIANECNPSTSCASPNVTAKKLGTNQELQCHDLINKANSIFGFNGWSHSVSHQTIDFVELEKGKYDIGVSALVKVMLKDGAYHEDVGYGIAKGLKCKGTAIAKARRIAAADALKNSLQSFGRVFENPFPTGKITDFLSPSQDKAKRRLGPEFEPEVTNISENSDSQPPRPVNNGHDDPLPSTSQIPSSLNNFFGTPFTGGLTQEQNHVLQNASPQKDVMTDREKRKRKIRQLEMEIASREKYKNELLMQNDFDDDEITFTPIVVKKERVDN